MSEEYWKNKAEKLQAELDELKVLCKKTVAAAKRNRLNLEEVMQALNEAQAENKGLMARLQSDHNFRQAQLNGINKMNWNLDLAVAEQMETNSLLRRR